MEAQDEGCNDATRVMGRSEVEKVRPVRRMKSRNHISREETAAEVWAMLESLYMTKSLTNRLHLKQKLFTFKFSDSRSIGEQLEEFSKCVDDFENIDEAIKDEDKDLMLLNSLPKSFDQFKDDILVGRDSM